MMRAMLCVVCLSLSAASILRLPLHASASICRSPVVVMESEMQWRRRMAEEKNAAASEAQAQSKQTGPVPDMATSVDRVDFFGGAGGGGTLTPEGIKNAQKTRSKTIDAMEELQEAVKVTAELPPAEAAKELSRVIGQAYEDGVGIDNPAMKKAAALLSALEAAGATAAKQELNKKDDSDGASSIDSKLNALFAEGFAPPPELDLD